MLLALPFRLLVLAIAILYGWSSSIVAVGLIRNLFTGKESKQLGTKTFAELFHIYFERHLALARKSKKEIIPSTANLHLSGGLFKFGVLLTIFLPGKLLAQVLSPDSACTPVIFIAESRNNICIGNTITFHATITNGGTNAVCKWKKNNRDVGVNNNIDYTDNNFSEGDVVYGEYHCKTECGVDTTVVSNLITVHVVNDFAPTITIANYDTLICEGQPTVFTATAAFGSATPTYKWTVNGSPVGTNTPTFSTSSITNGSLVKCELIATTPACPGTPKSSSSQMTIYVYPMIHPKIIITPSKTQICRGEEVTFTATANGGTYPRFGWTINGATTGADTPSLTTSSLNNGDTISCTITIDQDSRCHTSTSAPSNKVVMHVRDFTDPTLQIATPTPDVCPGTNITFAATVENAGDYKFYQWQVNGQNAGNNNSPVFISNHFTNGDKVSCTLTTSIPNCAITAKIASNVVEVTLKEVPAITFLPAEIVVMRGESANLEASVSGNPASFGWQPASIFLTPQSLKTSTVPLAHDTILHLVVIDRDGCTTSKDLFIKVLQKLYMPSAFTPNKDGKNDMFRIPADASLDLKEFSIFDRWGNIVFRTTDITKGWDGTYKNNDLSSGTFVYFIKGVMQDKEIMIKGTVTLIR